MNPTRFCLIRHGETDWNIEHRIQGQIDIPLNQRGREQAKAIAASLNGHRFAALYSSDLQRARDTAAFVAAPLGLEPRIEPGLRERHCGLLQTFTREEGKERFPEVFARYAVRDPDFNLGTGESLKMMQERVASTLERLAAKHAGESVLCITHGGILDIAYRLAKGVDLTVPRNFEIPNAVPNWIEIGREGWRLVAWGAR